MQWSDAIGKRHDRYAETPRIVSLVPSLTELLVDLGLAEHLVGRTGFCVHPRHVVRRLPKLGGTKGFAIEKLRALAPTHVLVNIDENRREEVAALHAFVPQVIVTHPLAVRDNLALYQLLGGIFGRDPQVEARARALAADFERESAALSAQTATLPRQKVLYLIWQQPWLSVARDTYISQMLAAAGWDSLPVESALRYPEVDLPALAGQADWLLLSSEPYPFREKHLRQLAEQLPSTRATLIDGEMVSWYGSRAIRGLAYLRRLRARLA